MKLPQIPLHDLEGGTLNFEALQLRTILDSTPQSFLQLLTAGTVAVTFGSVSFTFSASAASASQTVTHSIGRTPRVWLQLDSNNDLIASAVTARAATTFTAHAFRTDNVAASGTVSYVWLAIG